MSKQIKIGPMKQDWINVVSLYLLIWQHQDTIKKGSGRFIEIEFDRMAAAADMFGEFTSVLQVVDEHLHPRKKTENGLTTEEVNKLVRKVLDDAIALTEGKL